MLRGKDFAEMKTLVEQYQAFEVCRGDEMQKRLGH
jgi:hypothetical protein